MSGALSSLSVVLGIGAAGVFMTAGAADAPSHADLKAGANSTRRTARGARRLMVEIWMDKQGRARSVISEASARWMKDRQAG